MNSLNGVCGKCHIPMGWIYEVYGNSCMCSHCGIPVHALKPIEESVMLKKIELTENELYYVKLILSADYVEYLNRVEHAVSHGGEYESVRGEAIGRVVEKLDA